MADYKRKGEYNDKGSEVGVLTQRSAREVSDRGYIPLMSVNGDLAKRESDRTPRSFLMDARNEELRASRSETPQEAGKYAMMSVNDRGQAMGRQKKGILSSRASR